MHIEEEIAAIHKRNRKVELEKSWETSLFRRGTIALFTYAIAAVWLYFIGNDEPWLNAFVPAGGYLLSTFSLPVVKEWWMKSR